MRGFKSLSGLIFYSGFVLCAGSTALATIKAPTKPLSERVENAETVFLGTVVNKVVTGDWARAEILVEEPLKNAEKDAKVEVIWRIKIGGLPIFDTAAGTQGVAILKDKHEGRFWLRSDKFEKPEKLDAVKDLIKPEKETGN
jgi:hypothetical protein